MKCKDEKEELDTQGEHGVGVSGGKDRGRTVRGEKAYRARLKLAEEEVEDGCVELVHQVEETRVAL